MGERGQDDGAHGRPLWQPLAPAPTRLDDPASDTVHLASQEQPAPAVPPPRLRPTISSGFPSTGAVPTQRAPLPPPFARGPSAAPPPAPDGGGRRWAWWIGGGSTALVLALAAGLFLTFGTHASPRPVPSLPTAPAVTPTVPPAQDTAAPAPSVPATSLVTVSTGGNVDTGDPALAPVVAVLDRHFGAINEKDYAAWRATVTSRRAASVSSDAWQEDYASTEDGSAVVGGLRPAGDGGYLVALTFVSTQDPADAPADLPVSRICWNSTWPVTSTSGRMVLDTPASGSTTKEAC